MNTPCWGKKSQQGVSVISVTHEQSTERTRQRVAAGCQHGVRAGQVLLIHFYYIYILKYR